jgi:hypothetical protein
VKKRSKFKDVQIFKEISEILNIEFQQAEELFFVMNKKTISERYQLLKNEDVDLSGLDDEKIGEYNAEV